MVVGSNQLPLATELFILFDPILLFWDTKTQQIIHNSVLQFSDYFTIVLDRAYHDYY